MKRIISFFVVVLMLFSFVACGINENKDDNGKKDVSGVESSNTTKKECVTCVDDNKDSTCDICGKAVEVDNTLVCGVTFYNNMSEKDSNGEWTGFEVEFAQEVCKLIGMEVKFLPIAWPDKYNNLDSGAIDCIWNGFEANRTENGIDRRELVDLSYGYMSQQQCIVVRKDDLAKYSDEASLRGKLACAELGSAEEVYAKGVTDDVSSVESPVQALELVNSGAFDFAVVGVGLAKNLCGIGDFADLAIVESIEFDLEVYAVAFKKGSDLTDKVNGAIKELFDNGKLIEIAKKYGFEYALCLTENIDDVKKAY